MKKRIFLKVKVLPQKEYRRLSRILKLRLGCNFDSARAIFKALEYGCQKLDSEFHYEITDFSFAGAYEPENHTVYLTEETYDSAWSGDANALFTIVHEISHWALITVFGIKPELIMFELPLVFVSTTDAELYADTFSCYLMIPQVVTNGCKRTGKLLRKILKPKKSRNIIKMSLAILKNRRDYRAVGHKNPTGFHRAKKIA